jgi:hypothetical protein
MAWFKVDDHFWSHPKTGDLSDGATALWLRAGSWAAGHLTDGFVPDSKLRLFRARRRSIDELVDAGLWRGVEGGYNFHDWSDYQPSREAVTARRDATRNRVNTWRERQGNGVTGSEREQTVTPSVTPPPTRPDPTRPVPKGTEKAPARRATRLPTDFKVTELLAEYARLKAPSVNLDLETEKFSNYWTAKAGAGGTKLDWPATWKNWMLRVHDDNLNRGWRPGPDEVEPGQEWMTR